MIRVFEKRGDSGQLREIEVDKISISGTAWIDAHSPSKEELELISKKTRIPLFELSEYSDPDERPHLHDKETHSRIVFSFPREKGNSAAVAPVFIFLFGRQGILTLHKKEIRCMDRIVDYVREHHDILKSSSSFLHYFLDTLVSEYFKFFDMIEESVDRLEENITKNSANSSGTSTQQIFSIKRTLILFHKGLIANRDVIATIEKGYIKKMTKRETEAFRDIYNDLVQLIDVGDTNREILSGVLETYLTTLSNNMNSIMKKLTAYASLILVPTLISGIYGMNFRYMPELAWKTGYPFALGLMALSIIIIYVFFKRKKWI